MGEIELKFGSPGNTKDGLMSQTHCTGPEAGQGQGTGLGMVGFYIMLCIVHTTWGQGKGQGTIVSYCARIVPCPSPVHCV